jgi:hypothetical protein
MQVTLTKEDHHEIAKEVLKLMGEAGWLLDAERVKAEAVARTEFHPDAPKPAPEPNLEEAAKD